MCGICGAINLTGNPIPDLERRLEVMNDLIAHRGPRRRGRLDARARPRRLRAPAPEHHRPRAPAHQPMTDERRQLDHLQRRDLQLPRAARRARRRPLPHRLATPRSMLRAYERWGDELRSTGCAACSPSRSGTRPSSELFCARDRFGIKPFYYATGRRRPLLRLRGEGAAALPAARSRPTSRRSRTTSPSSSASPARRSSRACSELLPGPLAARSSNGAVRDRALLGGLLRARLRPHRRSTSRSASRELLARLGAAAPAQRRAGRRLPERRPRLEHRRRRSPARDATSRDDGVHRQVLARTRATTRAATRATRRGATAASSCTRSTSTPTTSLDTIERGRSTTSTTPSPAPGRSRSTWSRSWRAEHAQGVLGGQGGDEIFGGYARYLIAYFEQCIKAAIDGTMHSGNFVVTYESIIPNLVGAARVQAAAAGVLARGPVRGPRRALLPPRSTARRDLSDEVDWDALGDYSPFETFQDDLQRRQRRQASPTSTR